MGGHLPLEVMLLDRPIDPGGSTLNDTSYVFFFPAGVKCCTTSWKRRTQCLTTDCLYHPKTR